MDKLEGGGSHPRLRALRFFLEQDIYGKIIFGHVSWYNFIVFYI